MKVGNRVMKTFLVHKRKCKAFQIVPNGQWAGAVGAIQIGTVVSSLEPFFWSHLQMIH